MKALTLTQPWATLVAIGAKKFETRSWSTDYRGPLAIHAAKGFPKECKDLCIYDPYGERLLAAGFHSAKDLPLGMVVAICELIGCGPVETIREAIAGTDEIEFGDYHDGRFAWQLAKIQKLDEPIPARGMLGLWEWNR